ncbi:MAG TPA: hypothetical protein DD791_14115 [Syntrophomonas sp.]|nr:hypothetical protein [Syntrophomonas sp.]
MNKVLDDRSQNKLSTKNPFIERGIFSLEAIGRVISGGLVDVDLIDPGGSVADMPTCFAKGTKIMLADGRSKQIELLTLATPNAPTSGDALLSIDGQKVYVVGMVAGRRPEPCVRITAKPTTPEYKKEQFVLTISLGHTVLVGLSRMVHAVFLRTGDYVSAIYGQAMITKRELVEYDDEVFNVYLASMDFIQQILPTLTVERLYYHIANSSLGLTPRQHLIFGNGILSGDLYIQTHGTELARLGQNLTSFV